MAEVSRHTFTKAEIKDLVSRQLGPSRTPERVKIITDTTDFFRVEYNDVVVLAGTPYLVRRYEKEGRFGLDEEPKYWVRRAIDLTNGATRILKLVFHEKFTTRIGGVEINCYRSPRKEARILKLVGGHRKFMQGHAVRDAAGNIIRILEFIRGPSYDSVVSRQGAAGHEDYFYNFFPEIFDQFIELTESIKFLHDHGEKHGDIRRDHILWDRELKTTRWIDFDYNYQHGESMFSLDLQGLGNILIFLAGRGDVLVPDLYHHDRRLFERLWGEDLNISFKNRVANLKKIYPYIPESLNRILLHFSQGAGIFYETTDQMLEDMAIARADLASSTGCAP